MLDTIEVDKLMTWHQRRQRDIEWTALKEYWRASKEDKPVVMALYGGTLVRALEKWKSRRSTCCHSIDKRVTA